MAKLTVRNLTQRTVECPLPGGRWLRLPPRQSLDLRPADRRSSRLRKLQQRAVVEVREEPAADQEGPKKSTRAKKRSRRKTTTRQRDGGQTSGDAEKTTPAASTDTEKKEG